MLLQKKNGMLNKRRLRIMAICKKCSKPYFHETNYENLCCKCYEKQKEKIYRELKNKKRNRKNTTRIM